MVRSKIDSETLKTMYSDGVSTKDIAVHFGVSDRGVRDRLTKLGINEGYKRMARKYAVNEAFFDVWSDEMAYTLGFILTDGCVYKCGNGFSITQKDRTPLDAIKRYMHSEHPIKISNNVHTLNVGSKRMVSKLSELGIKSRKSLTVGMPDVPDEYLAAFMRGVIDGDGWVHAKGYTIIITSGSEVFAKQLCERMTALGYPFTYALTGAVYRIKLKGADSIRSLYRYLYANDTLHYIEHKRYRMSLR